MRGVAGIVNRHNSPDCIGVAIERPFVKFNGMEVMQGMAAVAAHTADSAGLPWTFVNLSTVKKHATGKGNAKKPDMQAAALVRRGLNLPEDEADAAHIAACAMDRGLFE